GWWGAGRSAAWSDAVSAVQAAAAAMGVVIDARSARYAPWHPGRCAEIVIGDRVIGHAGELHPRVCAAFAVPARSAAAEIDVSALFDHAGDVLSAPRLSAYPVAKEDVALIVDASMPAGRVASALASGAGELLESIRLFDLYTGEQVGDGKKSLAFALRFRAPDRTLGEGESAAAREAAIAAAVAECAAVHRA
ncbi:MAG: phenylalanine--tRNA ligase subunit beta, partial [Nocardioides sp.]